MPQTANTLASPINIQVIEGQNAINNVNRNTTFEPVIEVQDAAGKPIAGASVTFILPSVGPGASFADGSKTLMIQTDATGRATARGLRPNRQTGQYEIRVTASHAGQSTSATITQTNAAPAMTSSKSGRKWAILLGVIGGGAAAAALAASGGGGSSPSPTQTTPSAEPASGSITPGTPGFGPPR
jgi:hypothetical protein